MSHFRYSSWGQTYKKVADVSDVTLWLPVSIPSSEFFSISHFCLQPIITTSFSLHLLWNLLHLSFSLFLIYFACNFLQNLPSLLTFFGTFSYLISQLTILFLQLSKTTFYSVDLLFNLLISLIFQLTNFVCSSPFYNNFLLSSFTFNSSLSLIFQLTYFTTFSITNC